MGRMVPRIGLLFIFIACVGCATNPVTGKSQFMLMSEQQEIQMGIQAAPSANWDFGGEYRDRELREYLGKIVKRIWEVSERPHIPVSFHIQNTSIPNAFALPGYVAMTRGLLAELDNEAQFAAVMGHEAGHVMARHSASRMSLGILQQVGLGIGGAVLSNTQGAEALLALGAAGSSLLLLKYDRSQELESDRLGVKYASLLGYDPGEAIEAHERLELAADRYMKKAGKESRSGDFLSDILSTHPRKDVRLEEIRQMISELPPYSLRGDGKFSDGFTGMTSGLREVNKAYFVYDDAERALEKKQYDEAERLILRAIAMNPDQAPFHDLRGRIALARNDLKEAEEGFMRSVALDPEYQPSIFGLGIIEFKRGRYERSLDFMNRSRDLYPRHPGTDYVSGLCYHEQNNPREALAHFGSFAESVGKHPDVFGYMGMNYEKIGRKDLALEAYTRQAQIAPDNEMGRHARNRISVLKPSATR